MVNDNLQPEAPSSAPALRPYVPFGLVKPCKPSLNIHIHRPDGSIYTFENAVPLDVAMYDPYFCTLFFNCCIIQLHGDHLTELPDLLRYHEPRFFECINPEHHLAPPEEAPIIIAINWQTYLWEGERYIMRKNHDRFYHRGSQLVTMD
jgi:hypothetical protein